MLIKIQELKTLFNCHICAGGDGIFKEIADDIAKVGVIDHTGIRNANHKMKGNLFCLSHLSMHKEEKLPEQGDLTKTESCGMIRK